MASISNLKSINGSSIDGELYYHGLLPREDVRLILKENGDFVVRRSEPKPGEPRSYILSSLSDKTSNEPSSMKHLVIHRENEKFYIETKLRFDCVQQLIDHYLSPEVQKEENGFKLMSPVHRQLWELEHGQIVILRKLGEGAFGEVSMGLFKLTKKSRGIKVAIKQAKLEKMGKEQIKEFMGEARHLRSLNHPNIVKFYGVAVLQEPLYMVMELASNGALDSYLKKNPTLPVETRTEMILQAAWGLEYLHSKVILHRDIAARNCLYGDKNVKIADFGLSRSGTQYQMDIGKKVPIRWLALETLQTYIYTQKTDVWSYGIMCWEIFNSGAEPYPGMTPADVNTQVRTGHRMTAPPNVDEEVQKMILNCWLEKPGDRPTMSVIAVILQRVTKKNQVILPMMLGSSPNQSPHRKSNSNPKSNPKEIPMEMATPASPMRDGRKKKKNPHIPSPNVEERTAVQQQGEPKGKSPKSNPQQKINSNPNLIFVEMETAQSPREVRGKKGNKNNQQNPSPVLNEPPIETQTAVPLAARDRKGKKEKKKPGVGFDKKKK